MSMDNVQFGARIWHEIMSQEKLLPEVCTEIDRITPSLTECLIAPGTVYFVGCGSSYHTGLIGQYLFSKSRSQRALCVTASELILSPECYIKDSDERDVFFLISRTGRTSEMLIAAQVCREYRGKTVAITSFQESELAEMCDISISLDVFREESTTSTRTATASTLTLTHLLALFVGDNEFAQKVVETGNLFFSRVLEYQNTLSTLVEHNDFRHFVFLGTGAFYGVAKEAELKVKEMARVFAEGNGTLEFRHGHKSVLDEQSLVVMYGGEKLSEYETAAALDIRQSGACLLLVSQKEMAKKKFFDFSISADPRCHVFLLPVYFQLVGQLIGFYQARKKGIDPASPRHHNYCVTF